MTATLINQPTDAGGSVHLRLWRLPALTLALIFADLSLGLLNGVWATAWSALAIAIFGIPHGTLDVEIAAQRLGNAARVMKLAIVSGYLLCAGLMALLWFWAPEFALILFLVLSIAHFSRDWLGKTEPFLALTVAWTLVALPALTKPAEVGAIFDILTGNQNGQIIAALLACISIPALGGALVFAFGSYRGGDGRNAVEVLTCIAGTFFLPPLIAFAVFFCGLHSPRHMAEALRETGALSAPKKAAIVAAVFSLSLGLGVLLLLGQGHVQVEAGLIRSAIVLISILTVPHFVLENLLDRRQALSAGRESESIWSEAVRPPPNSPNGSTPGSSG